MIKIINGTYGMRIGKQVKPINSSHPPISLSIEEETRLINLGIAEKIVNIPEEKAPEEKKPENVEDEKSRLSRMKVEQLKAMANDAGIELPKKAKKEEIIEFLINPPAKNEEAEDENVDAEAPELDAELPV